MKAKNKIASLIVVCFRGNGVSFVYCPALDITGYGNNHKLAKQSFQIVLSEYLRYTIENGTLEEDLRAHGWKNSEQPSVIINRQ